MVHLFDELKHFWISEVVWVCSLPTDYVEVRPMFNNEKKPTALEESKRKRRL